MSEEAEYPNKMSLEHFKKWREALRAVQESKAATLRAQGEVKKSEGEENIKQADLEVVQEEMKSAYGLEPGDDIHPLTRVITRKRGS